jgi:hypothetical protein
MCDKKIFRSLLHGSATGLVVGCFALSVSALAQSASHVFDLPQESLAKALLDYSAVSGQQIVFSEVDVAGKIAPALKGRHSESEALSTLLAGTDLVAEKSSSNGVMIRSKKTVAPR